MTMFDGSEETIYNVTYPLYATYMKLFGLLLITILVVISSSFVIWVILKNKELRNTNNLLIVNLLITDVIYTMTLCCIFLPLMISYLVDLDVYHDCNIIMPLIASVTMSNRMMILPPAVHRFVNVARPFSHHRILTKRRIILMIVVLWTIPVILHIPLVLTIHTVYIPSLGACAAIGGSAMIGSLVSLVVYILTFLLIIFSSLYLRHKIIHVKTYIRDLQESGTPERKLSKSQRLKELLTEQVKPTIGVFVVGGMDGVCNLLIGTILVFARTFPPIVQFQIIQIILVPLFLLQSLSHSLSYGLWNKNIRDEMCPCYPKRSRVIVLNQQ